MRVLAVRAAVVSTIAVNLFFSSLASLANGTQQLPISIADYELTLIRN